MKSLFLTGHDGFVGGHVTQALLRHGASLKVLVRDDAAGARASAAGLTPVRTGLDDLDGLAKVADGVDGIGHFAASENPAFLPVNRAAIGAMLGGLAGGAMFLMQGGSMVFGDTGPGGAGADPAFNPPPPLAARAALDKEVLAHVGARASIAYGSLVFGGLGAMVPNTLVRAARKAGFAAHIGNGSSVWSAVHVEDWAELMARVLLDGDTAGGKIFPAAQLITMAEAAAAVASGFQPPLPVQSVSLEEGFALWDFFAPGFGLNQRFDGTFARDAYGWTPRLRDITAEFAALVGASEA